MSSKSSKPLHSSGKRQPDERLSTLLAELARGEGFSASPLAGVKFMRSTIHVPRSPIVYDPCVVIIAQGRKTGYLSGRRVVYDPNHYLVLAVPMPFECETVGTPQKPVLGVSIGITPALVAELVLQMEPEPIGTALPRAMQAGKLDEGLSDATVRLLESFRSAEDARILGPQIVREIAYRVLRGPLGENLRALAAPQSHFGRISRVLRRIHADCAHPFEMEALAREAGMSISTFHTQFKAVTSWSPLQYIKNVRLNRARLLMVHEGLNASTAAMQVGYESASQFSREFKRLFGDGPAAVAHQLRRLLIRFD